MPCVWVEGLSPAGHADCPPHAAAGSGRGPSVTPPGSGTRGPRRAGRRWTPAASCAGRPPPPLARATAWFAAGAACGCGHYRVAVLPFVHGLLRRPEPLCQGRRRLRASLDRRLNLRRCRRLAVKMDQHARTPLRMSLRIDLAMKNAERRGSM